jgi:hypothetical protein
VRAWLREGAAATADLVRVHWLSLRICLGMPAPEVLEECAVIEARRKLRARREPGVH